MASRRIWEFIKKVGKDIDEQIWHKSGPHGAAELGAGLNHGHGYVMYGHGRHNVTPGGDRSEAAPDPQPKAGRDEPEQERERGGRER
jgi:hypothetical protein